MRARGRRAPWRGPARVVRWGGGGRTGWTAGAIRRLVEAFYPRVQRDPELAPLFPDDIRPVMERQYRFLTQLLGGPPLYSALHGPPMLRARHLPHPITPRRKEAWLRCMAEAAAAAGLPAPERAALMDLLAPLATHMVNRPDTAEDGPADAQRRGGRAADVPPAVHLPSGLWPGDAGHRGAPGAGSRPEADEGSP
jgi:hemoglobin